MSSGSGGGGGAGRSSTRGGGGGGGGGGGSAARGGGGAGGTGVTLFASMYFLGQTLGVALGAPVMDRYGGAPIFVFAALALPALAFAFTARLKRRAVTGR